MRIAILGASGHLAKCAFWAFAQDKENEFFLFSRSKARLEQIYSQFSKVHKTYINDYQMFDRFEYDLIFNGIGSWDSRDQKSNNIFQVTESYDNLIMHYQSTHPDSVSIHISSGTVYANDFQQPVDYETKTSIAINQVAVGDFYSAAKLNSEVKHRAFPDLHIVDIRLFGFFSRYMSLEYPYLLSALIRSAKENRSFKVVKEDFWRDYIHMDDFSVLLHNIVSRKINAAIDVRSKAPISKAELIRLFVERYALEVETDPSVTRSKTGIKPYYYSMQQNTIYVPQYTSLEAVEHELNFFMG